MFFITQMYNKDWYIYLTRSTVEIVEIIIQKRLCIELVYSILEEFSYNSNMHNLIANVTKFRQLLIEVYGADYLINGNFRHYSNQPKVFDIELIALSFAAESQGIISENNLYQIHESDYKNYRLIVSAPPTASQIIIQYCRI